MKVLIVFQYFWLKAFRIYKVVLSFIDVGCDVIVLMGQPIYPQGKAFTDYRATGFRLAQHAAGCSIYRDPLVSYESEGVLTLAANYLWFAFFKQNSNSIRFLSQFKQFGLLLPYKKLRVRIFYH